MIFGAAATEHFDASEFNEAIAAHGTPALWRKNRMCPCRDDRTGHASVDCPVCEDGMLWDDGEEVTLFAFNRKRDDLYDIPGQRLDGATTFTFPAGTVPGHLDMIVLQIGEMVVNNEIHVRGRTDNAGRSTERLRVRPAFAVEFVEAIVAGALVQYTVGDQVAVDGDGAILWAAGEGPADGAAYTMRYRARPTYVTWSPYSRDEGGQVMPHRSLALRYDFFNPKAVGEA